MMCRLCKKYIWDGKITSALFHLGIVHKIEAYSLWNTYSEIMKKTINGYFIKFDTSKVLKGKRKTVL